MELPKRKKNRLKDYDYRTANAYFITICIANREKMLWLHQATNIFRTDDIPLSKYGKAVAQAITGIHEHYPSVWVDHYVIMPNHVHLLLRIGREEHGRPMVAPTVSTVIAQMKGAVTKQLGFSLWQKGFHDHIVRNNHDYQEIWRYIDENPAKMLEDDLCRGNHCSPASTIELSSP